MSTALVTLVAMALMLTAVLSWSQASFSSLDSGARSWKEMVDSAAEALRTDIELTGANTTASYVEATVANVGRTGLTSFSQWDVLVEYYDGNSTYHIGSLAYSEDAAPSDSEWTVDVIYADDGKGQQEVFEPGILNPGEVMDVKLKLTPSPGAGSTNRVTVSSPNGVAASAQFQG